MKNRKGEERGNFDLRLRCTVLKYVHVEGATEEEARKNPWEFATDERETEQVDWEVETVTRTE